MPTFQYQLQQHVPNEGEIFRTGQVNGRQWIATGLGAATKVPELLNRLEAWLNATPNPTIDGFQQLLTEYLDWYRQRYYEAKRKECPLSDDEIVKSVGFVVATKEGACTTISAGDCQFSQLAAPRWQQSLIAQGFQQFQLAANDLLIIDPKRADVAAGIRQALKNQTPETLALDGPYPIAIWRVAQVKNQTEPTVEEEPLPTPKRNYGLLSLVVLAMAALLTGGYFFQDEISRLWPVTTDSTATIIPPIDSLSDMSADTTSIVVVPPKDTLTNIPPAITTDSSTTDDTTTNDENSNETEAQQYLSEANKAFNLAKAKEADGYGQEALKLYKSAKAYYEDYLALKPEQKANIKSQLAFIERKIVLLGNEASF